MNRRGFLKGLAAVGTIAAAPALAREGILMPVKKVTVPEFEWQYRESGALAIDDSNIHEFIQTAHRALEEQCTVDAKGPLSGPIVWDFNEPGWTKKPVINTEEQYYKDTPGMPEYSRIWNKYETFPYKIQNYPVHGGYPAGHQHWLMEYQEAVSQYVADATKQQRTFHEKQILEGLVQGATPASSRPPVEFIYRERGSDQTVKSSIHLGKTYNLSKEDLAILKKYPLTK